MHIEARERLTAERGQQIAAQNGYHFYTVLPNGRDAAIHKFIWTYAILSDLTEWGFGDRWCYQTLGEAILALGEWMERGGEGEPQGWIKHPDTGPAPREGRLE